MKPIEWVMLLVIVGIMGGGVLYEGYADHGWARMGCYVAVALLGCLALGPGWRAPRGVPGAALYFFLVPLIAGALLLIPLPAGLTAAISPVWSQWRDAREGAGLDGRGMLPLGLSPQSGWRSWNLWLASAAFFLGCLMVAQRRLGSWLLLWVVAAISCAEGALAFAHMLSGEGRARGSLFNPNHSAALILMGIPVAVALTLRWRERLERRRGHASRDALLFVWGALALVGIAWVACLSRGSIAAGVLVGVLWMGWEVHLLMRGDGHRAGRRSRLALGAAVVACVAVLLWFTDLPATLGERLAPEAQYGRVDLWVATGHGLAESRLVGLGLGGAEVALERHLAVPTRKSPVWTHSDWVQLPAELGLLGWVLLAGWFGLMRRAWRGTGKAAAAVVMSRGQFTNRALLAGLATVLLHSGVDFPLRIPLTGFVFLALLAVTLARMNRPTSPSQSSSRHGAIRKELV